jgi:hypothetical protein
VKEREIRKSADVLRRAKKWPGSNRLDRLCPPLTWISDVEQPFIDFNMTSQYEITLREVSSFSRAPEFADKRSGSLVANRATFVFSN